MTYAKKTLADLKISLSDRHDSGELPTVASTLAFWTRLLNKGINYCADKMRLAKDTSLTTSSGTIALPDDFLVINSVSKGDTPLAQVDATDLQSQSSETFWITGTHFGGFFLNTGEDTTYTVNYSFKPAELVTDSDICIIPDPEAVVSYAYAMLRKSETDPINDADKALGECDTRIAEMQDAYTINSNFQGFNILN